MPTQTPTLIRPKRGTRNQNIGSWEPRRRSFFVKSITVSVALPPQPKNPVEAGLADALLEIVNEIARNVNANSKIGNEDLRVMSRDSANVTKIPVSN